MMKRLILTLLCCLLLAACGQTPETPAEPPTAAPTDAQLQSFTLYHGDDNAENFISRQIQVPEINETVVIDQLILAGVLPEDTAVNTLAQEGTQLKIDLNDTFRNHLCTMGTAGERILVGSVVNTFLSAYGAQTVFLTVDGELLESGHVVYDFPLEFYS